MKKFLFLFLFISPQILPAQISIPLNPVDFSWQYIGNPNFSPDTVTFPSLAVSSTETPYVGFRQVYSPFTVTVMKFNGTDWENVGTPGSIQGWICRTSLALDLNGVPYFAFQEGSFSKVSVVKFVGGNWISIGTPEFSPSITATINLVISPQGIPYVAFVDFVSSRANVMKFDGTTWVSVGSNNFSANTTAANLAFSSSGELFIAFLDQQNSHRVNIMKFDGNSWNSFGPPGPIFSDIASDISIAVGQDGLPCIPYADRNAGNKLTVAKNTGIAWINVGLPLFSNTGVTQMILSIDQYGVPYVACDDSASATVYSFDGTIWNPIGERYFSNAYINNLSFAMSSSGKPFCGFIEISSRQLSVMKYGYPLGLKENERKDLSIYPNPASNFIIFHLPDGNPEIKTIGIYNAIGSLLFEMKTSESRVTVPVSEYPSGMYYIKVKSDNSVWSGKFCKI